jgi:hypothetical protein
LCGNYTPLYSATVLLFEEFYQHRTFNIPAMKMGPLIALFADFIAVPRAWESAAVAYTLLLLTVLLRTETYWLRVGAPEDRKALVLRRLAEQLRATDLTGLIWWSRPKDTELGARRAMLTAQTQIKDSVCFTNFQLQAESLDEESEKWQYREPGRSLVLARI